jgi:hypothetical protein
MEHFPELRARFSLSFISFEEVVGLESSVVES